MSTAAQRRFPCVYCEFRFKDALTLKRHTNVKHTQEESHVCDICAAVFYTKYKIDVHLASKHGINDQFKCEKCNKFLMSEWTLIKHKRKCSTTPCPVCGKEFLSKWKLENHVKGHLNNRCHICDECGKDFLHSFTLVEHIEIVHQGKRPFQCEGCPKTFSRKGSLRTHKLIHSGVRPFPCQLCEKKCREKIQLIKHLQKKHSIEDNQIQNYVKLIPKKEIVRSEDMQNILQDIGKIKAESVEETNVFNSVENSREIAMKLDVEIKHEISASIHGTASNLSDVEKNATPISVVSSKIMKRKVKTETEDLLDENAFINEVYGGDSTKKSSEDTTDVTVPPYFDDEERLEECMEESIDSVEIETDSPEDLDSSVDSVAEDNLEEFMFENIDF